MDRRHAVPGLGHGANIDETGGIVLAQPFDGFDQVPGAAEIDLHGLFRMIVRGGRNESGHVQNQVAALNGFFHKSPIRQIPKHGFDPAVPFIGLEPFPTAFVIQVQCDDLIASPVLRHLLQAFQPHAARSAGQEYFHGHSPFSFCAMTISREIPSTIMAMPAVCIMRLASSVGCTKTTTANTSVTMPKIRESRNLF